MPDWTTRSPHGNVLISNEFGQAIERDTLSCVHCGGHWVVEPGSGNRRGWCMNCAGATCGQQGCDRCVPKEKMIELIEKNWTRLQRVLG